MSAICFYFQVHQPYRLKKYSIFDIGHDHQYFENHPQERTDNTKILHKVISKCYLPANKLLLELLQKHKEFRISFSLSGVFLEQIQQFAPDVVESFQLLVKTGRCEILAETFYHSLSAIYSKVEFESQVKMHSELVQKLFSVTPKVFRNTELIYSNQIAKYAEEMGYNGIITEGVDRILQGRSPNEIYKPNGCQKITVLLKNYQLSDDIAFRFSDKKWTHHPLTTSKFSNWIKDLSNHSKTNSHIKNPLINLFMDYETFGEHQWEDSGIFKFLEHLPREFLSNPENSFLTPSEAIAKFALEPSTKIVELQTNMPKSNPALILDPTFKKPLITNSSKILIKYQNISPKLLELPTLDVPEYISWADAERDLSAWRSNEMQHEALDKIYSLEIRIKSTNDSKLLSDWRKLTTSDHFYYMCTKFWSDGDVHKYFSPYESPYEAFIYFMNAIKDLELRIRQFETIKEKEKNGT